MQRCRVDLHHHTDDHGCDLLLFRDWRTFVYYFKLRLLRSEAQREDRDAQRDQERLQDHRRALQQAHQDSKVRSQQEE